MKMKKLSILTGVMLLMCFSSNGFADEKLEEMREALVSILSEQLKLNSIAESRIDGIYEVNIGNQIYYATLRDGHILIGEAIDVETGESLSDVRKEETIAEVVAQTSVEDMVVFAAQGETKRHMTVFTDIDCGYCRRLHQEVPALNAAGLEVRYMAYPRAGIGSSSYEKIVTVWCSDDAQSAMTASKGGEYLSPVTCENPVAEQFEAGSRAGISGTPTLILDDGTMIGGYVPAENLLPRLGLSLN